MNADGTNLLRLTNDPGSDYAPNWSPDGGRIAFASTRSGGVPHIHVMNADGSGVTKLTAGTPTGVSFSWPAWSPDGRRIAVIVESNCDYYYYYYCEYSVQLMNTDGSGLTWLARADLAARPAWSPDGRTVAFSASYCVGADCPISVVYARADLSATDLIVLDGYSPSWRR
jgi:TolB protein